MKANRSINLFRPSILQTLNSTTSEIAWNRQYLLDMLSQISRLQLPDKKHAEDDWGMFLDSYSTLVANGHSCKFDFLQIVFCSTRVGFRSPLLDLATMQSRPNPKNPFESETFKTHVCIRMNDGLTMIEGYGLNVVTANRISSYFQKKAVAVYQQHHLTDVQFHPIVSKEFLDAIDNFNTISTIDIQVRTASEANSLGSTDAIDCLAAMSEPVAANKVRVVLQREGPGARVQGLAKEAIRPFVEKFMNRPNQLREATIKGQPKAGKSDTIRFSGIEERQYRKYDKNLLGEIQSDEIFADMIKSGNAHVVMPS